MLLEFLSHLFRRIRLKNKYYILFFRQVFCWMDRWHGLTMADIRALEEKTKEDLERLRKEGEVRGMRADQD